MRQGSSFCGKRLFCNWARQRKNILKTYGEYDIEAGTELERDAFLSGILPEDRLCPVITTIFYLGENWDGSRSLYDMFGLNWEGENPVLSLIYALIADGRQNLIGRVAEDQILREQLYQQYRV